MKKILRITLILLFPFIFFNSLVFSQTIPSNGLVAWYPFNGNANDESGNGNDLVNNQGTFTSDRFNNLNSAADLVGANKWLGGSFNTPGVQPFISNGTSSSVSVWIKVINNSYGEIYHEGTGSNGFGLYIHSDGAGATPGSTLSVLENNVNGNVTNLSNNGVSLGLNSWHHLVLVKSNNTVQLFVDGQFNSQGLLSFNTLNNGWLNFGIPDDQGLFFESQIDDIAIYNRALSESEVLLLSGFVGDIDGNVYKTVKICDDTWTAENLNVSHYRNGDPIPEVKDYLEWSNLTTGAWCYYENKTENGTIYGKLYNWYAITDPRGLAPEGWRISDGLDWGEFETCFGAGGWSTAGGSLKAVSDLWDSPNTGATNSSGFSALPGGFRTNKDANTDFQIGKDAWFAIYNEAEPVWFNLSYGGESINTINLFGYYNYFDKTTGVSVRCVKGKENSITFNALQQKTYGDAPFNIAATASSGLPITFISSNPSIAAVDGNTVTITGAGTVTITALQNGNHEYGGAAPIQQSLTINKVNLTATASNKSRTYGDVNPTFTFTYTGFKNGETSAVIDTEPTATSATVTSNVGTYNIVPAGGADNNYTFSYVNGTLTITQAALTATADNKSRVYGDANPALTITYTGFKNSETSSVLDTAPTATTSATLTSNVGAYNIVPANGTDNNYSFSYVNGTLTVDKATLTATADNKSRVYGDTNPAFTITYAGFKNNETSSVIDTPSSATTTATVNSNVGSYNIVPAGGTDNNYSFSYANGALTITQATLTATADNKSKVYGDANPSFTITYSGFKNSENSSVIDTAPTASTTATTSSNVGSYNIVPAGGMDNNYSLSYVNGTLTITQATLTATADNKSKVYGDANPSFTITYSGFKNSENSSVIDTPPLANSSAITASSVGTYDITVTGGVDNNYSFTYVSGVLTVTKQQQTISFTTLNNVLETAGPFVLNATSSSGLPVSFSSTNASKISITGNTVTILAPGSVTITAVQTGSGDYEAAPPLSQTICILPKKPTITPTGLDSENAVLTSSATNGNQWYRNGGILTGATNTSYTVDDEGQYTVKVSVDGCLSELSDPFTILITDIADPEHSIQISLFPNPARDELLIELKGVNDNERSVCTVYDLTGRVVTKQEVLGNKGSININRYGAGNYLLHVVNKKFAHVARFIKE